jgi:hypothetical protein
MSPSTYQKIPIVASFMSKLLGNGVQIDPNKMEIENSMRLAKMKHSG